MFHATPPLRCGSPAAGAGTRADRRRRRPLGPVCGRRQGLGDIRGGVALGSRDFLRCESQISVFIQVADNAFRRIADAFCERYQRELRMQMIA